jgi:ADP-ribose pyrophosphatase YjhB (NUDIX family)
MRRTSLKRRKDIPDRLWRNILTSIPIVCIDLIVHHIGKAGKRVLLGYRTIPPYDECWALPGGRVIKGESLCETADRQLKEIGLRSDGRYRLIGVYPVNFKHRSDISICLSTGISSREEPHPTEELSRFLWCQLGDLPERLGGNYRKMLADFKRGRYEVQ